MWDLLSTDIVINNATTHVFPHCEHRDELYIRLTKKGMSSDNKDLLEINPQHVRSSRSNTDVQTVQSHPAADGPHSTLRKPKQPHVAVVGVTRISRQCNPIEL